MWGFPSGGGGGAASASGGGILGAIGSLAGGPVGGLVGSALGGLFGFKSTRDINKQQIALAREQMAFQERMSNTQFQRAAVDLEKAGLNRILALGKPASSPGGAQPQLKDPGNAAINSALAIRRQVQELKNLEAQELLTVNQASTELNRAALIQSQEGQTQQMTQESVERMRNIISQRAGIQFDNQLKDFNQQIRQMQIPGVQNEEEFYKWLLSTEANEAFRAAGAAGPLVLAAVRAFMMANRSGR